jgi:hypothetical protein
MKNWKAESSLYWKTSRKIILKTGLSIADMLDNFSKAAILYSGISVMREGDGEGFRPNLAEILDKTKIILDELARANQSDPLIAIGDRVRFTADDLGDSLSVRVVEGAVVDIATTTAGNFRYRIRTDHPAPQGGGNIEKLVYSQWGTIAPEEKILPSAMPVMGEEEIAEYLLMRVMDGDLSLEDIPIRMARYGLMDSRVFQEEMRERTEMSS